MVSIRLGGKYWRRFWDVGRRSGNDSSPLQLLLYADAHIGDGSPWCAKAPSHPFAEFPVFFQHGIVLALFGSVYAIAL
jgi:hypothetical protein